MLRKRARRIVPLQRAYGNHPGLLLIICIQIIMSLQYKFFMINAIDPLGSEDELNKFLRSVRVVNVKREFVAHSDSPFWYLSVEYLSNQSGNIRDNNRSDRKSKIDYREILSDDDFAVFVKLRDWRKKVAEEDAIPVYTIFTNDQLAQISQKRVMEKASLQQISGVGDARVKKYGDDVISIVRNPTHKKSDEAEE